MKEYVVYTPLYDMSSYEHPPEYGSDVAIVIAKSKREAKIKGLAELRRLHSRWIQDALSDRRNPFRGLRVELAYIEDIEEAHSLEKGGEHGSSD